MYSVYQPDSTCEIDEYILNLLECCYNAYFLVACMNGFFFLNNSIVLVANVCGDVLQSKKHYNFVERNEKVMREKSYNYWYNQRKMFVNGSDYIY